MSLLPNQLVSFAEIKAVVKSFSANIDEQKVNSCVIESQNVDIKPLIGEQVYIALIEGETVPTKYQSLMDGCIYTYNGLKYKFEGLKATIIYFAYARIIKSLDNSVSAGGFVQKTNDYSQHSQIKERLNAANEAESIGNTYLKECVDYLKRNNDLFSEFGYYRLKKVQSIRALGD